MYRNIKSVAQLYFERALGHVGGSYASKKDLSQFKIKQAKINKQKYDLYPFLIQKPFQKLIFDKESNRYVFILKVIKSFRGRDLSVVSTRVAHLLCRL